MQIKKRSGQLEAYDGSKIVEAMKKSFASVGTTPTQDVLQQLLQAVEQQLEDQAASVEEIQDQVERTLMAQG